MRSFSRALRNHDLHLIVVLILVWRGVWHNIRVQTGSSRDRTPARL